MPSKLPKLLPKFYICPVCTFDEMTEPPSDWNICPCCGTEFEYDDAKRSHEELRRIWVEGGAHWWSGHRPPPLNAYARVLARLKGSDAQ